MQVSIFGSKYTLPIAFRLSADAKGDNLLIGLQSQSALRPCPCCFLPSREFSNPNYLHCDESALPKMSELRSQLQTQLSQTLPDSADALWQAGATTMSIIASQPSTWTRVSQKPLRAVLQLPFLRVPIEHLLSDANEAVALLLDNDISGKHCDVEEVQPGKLKWLHQRPIWSLNGCKPMRGSAMASPKSLWQWIVGCVKLCSQGDPYKQSGTRSHAGQNLRGYLDSLQVLGI
jgi:hypothetical protein